METSTFKCLYCFLDKDNSESSLEHAIPQFMGGNIAPSQYKLRNVCRTCNNRLGLYVDGAYAKSWFIANTLTHAAFKLYAGLKDAPIPLTYIGHLNLEGLKVPMNQVVESWIGPSGETIIWIREHDDDMFGYAGGNPIDAKTLPSVVYMSFTSNNSTRFHMALASFDSAFKKKKARRVLCTELRGVPEGYLLPKFDAPTKDDIHNIQIINKALSSGNELHSRAQINTKFDSRFIAKMVLGVGYSLFGKPFLDTDIAINAKNDCWPSEDGTSQLRGVLSLVNPENATVNHLAGYPGATSIVVTQVSNSYVMSVSIDQKLPFVVEIAPATLSSSHINLDTGYILLLFPSLNQAVELTIADLLAHKAQAIINSELLKIDLKLQAAKDFQIKLGEIN